MGGGRGGQRHWEGGQGCRSKNLMAKGERKKYAGNSKTASRKSERVGAKGSAKGAAAKLKREKKKGGTAQ